jgi:hypothetical protein
MSIIHEKLALVFKAAEKLNENLWLDGPGVDSAAMSVDEFKDHVEHTYNVTVEFFELDVDEIEHVYGFIERYGDNGQIAKVYIAKSIGPRWIRFVGIKELCQVVVDSPGADFRVDGEDTLQRLIAPGSPDINAEENTALRSETVAEYLAYELAYPHEMRVKDLKRLDARETTVADLGAQYKIPNHIVETVLSNPYMKFAQSWWDYIARLDKDAAAAE